MAWVLMCDSCGKRIAPGQHYVRQTQEFHVVVHDGNDGTVPGDQETRVNHFHLHIEECRK